MICTGLKHRTQATALMITTTVAQTGKLGGRAAMVHATAEKIISRHISPQTNTRGTVHGGADGEKNGLNYKTESTI